MQNCYRHPEDIYCFFELQQASKRLIKHHQLVVKAADSFLEKVSGGGTERLNRSW